MKNTSKAELRDRLRSRGQPSGCSKSDLIKYLLGHKMEEAEETEEDLKQYTVPELKEQLNTKNQQMAARLILSIVYWTMRMKWRTEWRRISNNVVWLSLEKN